MAFIQAIDSLDESRSPFEAMDLMGHDTVLWVKWPCLSRK
jgi:hypothetical protein